MTNHELARVAATRLMGKYPISVKRDYVEDIIADTYAEAFPQWIACSERMPDIYRTVLLSNDKHGGYSLGFLAEDGTWISDETYDQEIFTHWQPLPQPPEVTK